MKQAVSALKGVIGVSLKSTELTVHHKSNGVPLRDIIKKLQKLGHTEATFVPSTKDKNDIREVLNTELNRYARKFLLALLIHIPIFVMMWVIPYAMPELMTKPTYLCCKPVYILVLFVLASIN